MNAYEIQRGRSPKGKLAWTAKDDMMARARKISSNPFARRVHVDLARDLARQSREFDRNDDRKDPQMNLIEDADREFDRLVHEDETYSPKIRQARIRHSSLQGELNGVTKDEISQKLGFEPNAPVSLDEKSDHGWDFEVDGVPHSIWDWKGSHKYGSYSVFGPPEFYDRAFPGKHRRS